MPYQRHLRRVLLTAAFVLSIGLLGCDTAAPTATVAPAPAATATTAGPATATTGDSAGAATPTTGDSTAAPTATTATTGQAACTKLNLNTATEAQLITIPNFSSRWVREFLEYRPYVSIQQFRQQLGKYVDQTQVAEWEKYVYVPVSPNDSDAATLEQIPGVTEAVATALTGGRPYATDAAFLTALGAQVSADQAAQAQCLLAAATQ